MLCDELKVYVPQDGPYGLEPEEGGKLVEEETCYLKSEVDAAIAELKADNERLKYEKRKMYTKMQHDTIVDALCREHRQQLRSTRRALWLARAKRAEETQFLWQVYCHCDKLYVCGPSGLATRKNPYRYISRKNAVEWDEFLGKIKNKCLKKAEAYK